MANYATVEPTFWTGDTGRKLREAGPEAQLVALYLLTNSHRNSIGLYYLPKMLISHETALSKEGASKGLQRGILAGFCVYDEVSEVVWVKKMASYQIAPELKPNDKRVKWIEELYRSLPNNPFLHEFWEEYGSKFHIQKPRGSEGASKALACPSEDPSKPITIPIPTTTTTAVTKKKGPAPEQTIALPEWLDLNLWQEFKEYRQGLPKAKFTAKAEKLCLNDLVKLVDEYGVNYQTEIIQNTIKSCKWLSFYPPRNGNGKPAKKLQPTMEIFARREFERQAQEADRSAESVGSDPDEVVEVLPS